MGQSLISRTLSRMIMKQARVVEVQTPADQFRLITLDSDAFIGRTWAAGQKIQIAMGSAFIARTFTPMAWDGSAGRTRLLGFIHGHGPASAWLSKLASGDGCEVFGPRSSLELDKHDTPIVLLGDETSIGLACAIGVGAPERPLRCLLEAGDPQQAQAVCSRLGLDHVECCRRTDSEAHLVEIEHHLVPHVTANASFLLTGRAAMVQRLRRWLLANGVVKDRVRAKPYWAPGKTGLD